MIHVSHLCMRYDAGASRVDALRDVDLQIGPGERVAVTGPSGCGKTTLLVLIAGLERPTSGTVTIDGAGLENMDADALADLRRDRIGIVFQSFHLVPSLTALDNVALPLEIAATANARSRAEEMLAKVGLGARGRHYPSQLSGGEQQRVAIARALVNEPEVLLADEPTGNLDPDLTLDIMDLIASTATRGTTVIVATHELGLVARYGKRIVRLEGGGVVEDSAPPGGGA